MRVGWAWLDSCAPTAGQRTSSIDGPVLILAGMVAVFALTMEENRQAMILMLGDVMSVGERSGQVGELGTFNLAVLRRPQRLRLGLTSVGVAGFGGCLRGFSDFRWSVGLRPCSFRGKGDWCVLETVGDITHGQVWVEADHYLDCEDVAGVGKPHDYSDDNRIS